MIKRFFNEGRSILTMDCLLLGIWAFNLIFGYYRGSWLLAGLGAVGVVFNWRRVWKDFDRYCSKDDRSDRNY